MKKTETLVEKEKKGFEEIAKPKLKIEHKIIAEIVEPKSKVLDLGCGDGQLLYYLVRKKNVQGFGIEIDEKSIYRCVEKGLSVSHEDIDSGLIDYPEKFFDYVILNQTMQQVKNPKKAINRALKIGRKVIVGFPNFCHIVARFQISILGIVPVTHSLPYHWYDTPNTHFLSIRDFSNFCKSEGIIVEKRYYTGKNKRIYLFPNLFAHNAIFILKQNQINTN